MPKTLNKEKRRFTYADYCTWSDEKRWELIDGIAYEMTPAPSRTHSLISGKLFRMLGNFLEGKACEVHHAPFDVRLPRRNKPDEEIRNVVQPDILVVCDEGKLDDRGCRGAPDLIIEILSPSTASRDCIVKKNLYEKHGVKEFWLVDPANRIVTIYTRQSDGLFGKPTIYADEDVVEIALFPGLKVDLGKVFPPQPKIIREDPVQYL